MFKITCTSANGNAFTIDNSATDNFCNPIVSAVAVLPTFSPGGSFINLLKGGLSMNEAVLNRTLTLAYPLSTAAGKSFFASPSGITCNYINITTSTLSTLSNAAGEPIKLPTAIKFLNLNCTPSTFRNLKNKLGTLISLAQNIDNYKSLEQVEISVNVTNLAPQF